RRRDGQAPAAPGRSSCRPGLQWRRRRPARPNEAMSCGAPCRQRYDKSGRAPTAQMPARLARAADLALEVDEPLVDVDVEEPHVHALADREAALAAHHLAFGRRS